jgi:hypothetical protein
MHEHKQRRQRDPLVAVLKRMVLDQQTEQDVPFSLTKIQWPGLIPDFHKKIFRFFLTFLTGTGI